MPFVEAKCTNCGAHLSVDNSKDAAICQYCGTPFIVEKAINHYHTTQNISGSVVNIYGGNSSDFEIRAGTLVKYNGAETEVEIPRTVKIIGKDAFNGCEGLTKVIIPDSVIKIERNAFSKSGLHEVVVPKSVRIVESGAFSYCRNLKKAIFLDTVDYVLPNCIAEYMFCGCIELVHFDIPTGIKYIGRSAFSGCYKLNISIPSTICSFGPGAFAGCTNLRSVVIPLEMKNIGDDTFSGCSNLTNVTIHQGVKTIGHHAFKGCSKLTNVVIPHGVTSIGQCAFKDCVKLGNISLPDSVTDVSPSTFEGCNNIILQASKEWKRQHWNAHPTFSSEHEKRISTKKIVGILLLICGITLLLSSCAIYGIENEAFWGGLIGIGIGLVGGFINLFAEDSETYE